MFFDPLYFLFAIPPLLLGLWAQYRVKSTFAEMSRVGARMTGAQAARTMLDSAGLHSVGIEQIGGQLSDHYDPSAKVLRLSPDVYGGRSMAAVGVACHEAGHAIQDARQYAPLVIRNLAVPIANFGGSISNMLLLFGFGAMAMGARTLGPMLFLGGILGFSAVVFFQVVNLPVEFDASARAKRQLVDLNLISEVELPYVSSVLNAAALTYVAGTLQAVMTLLYLIFRFTQSRE